MLIVQINEEHMTYLKWCHIPKVKKIRTEALSYMYNK